MNNREITFELTNYCEHKCKFCSSLSVADHFRAVYIEFREVERILGNKRFDHIFLSGGEPLSHPMFYDILKLCEKHTEDVVVYSNAIRHLIYNAQAIDGVYLECEVTPTPETRRVKVLKRIGQGREFIRPEVALSRNNLGDCECNHITVNPRGELMKSPCAKYLPADRPVEPLVSTRRGPSRRVVQVKPEIITLRDR